MIKEMTSTLHARNAEEEKVVVERNDGVDSSSPLLCTALIAMP